MVRQSHGAAIFKLESPFRPTRHLQPNQEGDAHKLCVRGVHLRFTYEGWRGLGGAHSDGEDPLLRLFQQLELHQHHELEFWCAQDIEKSIGREADMVSAWRSIFPLVRRGRLPLITWTKFSKVDSPRIQQCPRRSLGSEGAAIGSAYVAEVLRCISLWYLDLSDNSIEDLGAKFLASLWATTVI